MTTVGILGGGQLGWMLSESIFKYGGTPLVLAKQTALATDRVPGTIVGSWSDPTMLELFFAQCDLVTIEVEHVDVEALEPFAQMMTPSLDVIRMAQHRIVEKTFLRQHGFPHAAWEQLTSTAQARELASSLQFPLIAKVALGGYDGRGQYRLSGLVDYHAMLDELGEAVDRFGVVLEEPLDLFAEASVIVARGRRGTAEFPVFDNDHRDHILDVTEVPSQLPDDVQAAMRRIAAAAADAMELRGMLTTEFLVTKRPGRDGGLQVGDYYVFVNEFAPRPHNSGHVSRNACTVSQFDALARVLLDLPPEQPVVTSGHWCMANLLSDLWSSDTLDIARGMQSPGLIDVVLYGKQPTRTRRKMGHVVARASERVSARERAEAFRNSVSTEKP